MARLLDNWLQPLIDTHLPNLWRFAQQSQHEELASSQVSGTWTHSSPGSQPRYKVQHLVLPRQNILQLRILFADDSTEALQLLTYPNRDHGNHCTLSDGTSAVSARLSVSAVQQLRAKEKLSLSNLSIGTILQVPSVTFKFTFRADSYVVRSIKTQLDVLRFSILSRTNEIYGRRPVSIGDSTAYRAIIGQTFPAALFRSSQRRPSLVTTISTSASPHRGAHVNRARQESDTSLEIDVKPTQIVSEAFSEATFQGLEEQGETKALSLSTFEQDLPIPSIEMTTSSKAFDGRCVKSWKHLSKVPQAITLATEDQESWLNGDAHLTDRGERTPIWIPRDERGTQWPRAPLPERLKGEILAALATGEEDSDEASVVSGRPVHDNLKITPRSLNDAPNLIPRASDGNGLLPNFRAESTNKDNGHVAKDMDDESDASQISGWEETPSPPPPPRIRRLNELPPDTPEQASSMPAVSSPVGSPWEMPPLDHVSTAKSKVDPKRPVSASQRNSTDLSRSASILKSRVPSTQDIMKPSAVEASRPAHTAEASTRHIRNSHNGSTKLAPVSRSSSIAAPRYLTETPRGTPQPSAGPRKSTVNGFNPAAYRPHPSYIPSTYGSPAYIAPPPIPPQAATTKRKADEHLAPAVQKKRNLNIAFGAKRDSPASQNPSRQISSMKRQFIDHLGRQAASPADPTSSRIPETQSTPARHTAHRDLHPLPQKPSTANSPPQLNRMEPATRSSRPSHDVILHQTTNGHANTKSSGQLPSRRSSIRSASPLKAVTIEPESLDPYHTFKHAYPAYTGDQKHFAGLCKQLLAVQTTFPKILWDDFIIRHKGEYVPYVSDCVGNGEQPTPYVEFCSDYDREYNKRVLTPTMLKEAANNAK